jgi:hypothetical protein
MGIGGSGSRRSGLTLRRARRTPQDGSRNRFVNLVFRFDNKWCYTSEEITAIFLAPAGEEEEQKEAALCGAH